MIDQTEVHVLIHVCLFEAFTRNAVRKKYAGLNVNIEAPEWFVFKRFLEELLVCLFVFWRDIKVVESLMGMFLDELN